MVRGDGGRDAILRLNAMVSGNEQGLAKKIGCSLVPQLRCAGAATGEKTENNSFSRSLRQRRGCLGKIVLRQGYPVQALGQFQFFA